MNRKSIYAFIIYGVNKNLDVKELSKMNLGISIFYIIGIIYGLILGSTERILSYVMIAVMLSISVFILLKIKKNLFSNIIAIMAMISLEATINFTIFALILCSMLEKNSVLHISVISAPIIVSLIYICFTKHQIKKEKFFDSKRIKKDKLYLYSMIAGIAGIFVAKIAFSSISQTKALQIGIICMVFLAVCFSFGTINFLKISYIKKYCFTDRDLIE